MGVFFGIGMPAPEYGPDATVLLREPNPAAGQPYDPDFPEDGVEPDEIEVGFHTHNGNAVGLLRWLGYDVVTDPYFELEDGQLFAYGGRLDPDDVLGRALLADAVKYDGGLDADTATARVNQMAVEEVEARQRFDAELAPLRVLAGGRREGYFNERSLQLVALARRAKDAGGGISYG